MKKYSYQYCKTCKFGNCAECLWSDGVIFAIWNNMFVKKHLKSKRVLMNIRALKKEKNDMRTISLEYKAPMKEILEHKKLRGGLNRKISLFKIEVWPYKFRQ